MASQIEAKMKKLLNDLDRSQALYNEVFDAKLKVVTENNALRQENNLLRVCLARTQEALVVALVGRSAGRGNNGGSGGESA